jgi:hypothetical protein
MKILSGSIMIETGNQSKFKDLRIFTISHGKPEPA